MVRLAEHLVCIDPKVVAKCSAVSSRMAMHLKAAGVICYVPKELLKGYLAGSADYPTLKRTINVVGLQLQ